MMLTAEIRVNGNMIGILKVRNVGGNEQYGDYDLVYHDLQDDVVLSHSGIQDFERSRGAAQLVAEAIQSMSL